jgi:hypothetical protein
MSFTRRKRKKSICYYIHGEFPTCPFFLSLPRAAMATLRGACTTSGRPFCALRLSPASPTKEERIRQAENASPAATRNENNSPHHRQLGNMQQQHTLNNIHLSRYYDGDDSRLSVGRENRKMEPSSRYILAAYVVPSLFRFEMTTGSCRADTWPTSAISAMIMLNQFHEQTYNTGNIKP